MGDMMGDDVEEMEVHDEIEQSEAPEETFQYSEMANGIMWTYWRMFFDYWFLWVIVAVIGIFLYNRYIAPAVEKFSHYLADREMEAKLHKNPDLLIARQESMLEARRRMQEKHDAEAARMAEIRKHREEKKKEEILSKNRGIHADIGYKLNDTPQTRRRDGPTSHPNRTDYNPLMGSGSGGYRPPRRSCPGGGCG